MIEPFDNFGVVWYVSSKFPQDARMSCGLDTSDSSIIGAIFFELNEKRRTSTLVISIGFNTSMLTGAAAAECDIGDCTSSCTGGRRILSALRLTTIGFCSVGTTICLVVFNSDSRTSPKSQSAFSADSCPTARHIVNI